MDHFWLTDAQFTNIARQLVADTQGNKQVDDRRVISDIMYARKSGCRWSDTRREVYGPKKTFYNRFIR